MRAILNFLFLLFLLGCQFGGDKPSKGQMPTVNGQTDPVIAVTSLSNLGPPIDINALKSQDWLETTSGVLSQKEQRKLCPNDSTSFFGFYNLIDKVNGGGPFGKLIVRIREKPANWNYADTNEEFLQLTLRSDRVKVWNKVAVGDHINNLMAIGELSPDHKMGYDKGMFEVLFGEYQGTCSTAADTIRVLTINRICN